MARGLAVSTVTERMTRAQVDYARRPSKKTWDALLKAEDAWLRQMIKTGTPPPSGWRLSRKGFQNGG